MKKIAGIFVLIAVAYAALFVLRPRIQAVSLLTNLAMTTREAREKDSQDGPLTIDLLLPPYAPHSADPDCPVNFKKFRELRSLPNATDEAINIYCSCVAVNIDRLTETTKSESKKPEVELVRRVSAIEKSCMELILKHKT